MLNKIDLLEASQAARLGDALKRELMREPGRQSEPALPVYLISAATGQGCDGLVNDLMKRLAELAELGEQAEPGEWTDEAAGETETMALQAEHG